MLAPFTFIGTVTLALRTTIGWGAVWAMALGTAVSGVGGYAWLYSDAGAVAASDAQGSLIYLFLPIAGFMPIGFGLLIAIVVFVTGDAAKRRVNSLDQRP